jgi:hypothetical protein
MPLTALQQLILETLSEQSEGYLTSPDASAFVAKGMEDSDDVAKELVSMQEKEWVEFFVDTDEITVVKVEKDDKGEPIIENGNIKPILDEDDNIQTEVVKIPADEGWIITDKGRKALNE